MVHHANAGEVVNGKTRLATMRTEKEVKFQGKFVFTAHDDGEHLICAYINETHPLYRAQNFVLS